MVYYNLFTTIMAENKTVKTAASVTAFLNKLTDEQKRKDSYKILEMMREISGEEPKMWGTSIIGFGEYHYKYKLGRKGDFLRIGFSPRKQNLTLYIMPGFDKFQELLSKLGKYTTGKSCLYLKSLAAVDLKIMKQLIKESYNANLGF